MVAIKDMEMPKNCSGCKCLDPFFKVYCMIQNKSIQNKETRPQWCPLINVEGIEIKEANHES